MELPAIQRISPVVPRTVGDEGDELGVVLFGFAGLCGECVQEQVDEVDVAQLVASADVVGGTRGAFAQDGVDGAAVVFDVQPVADVEAAVRQVMCETIATTWVHRSCILPAKCAQYRIPMWHNKPHYLLFQGRTRYRSQCRSLPPLRGLSQEGTTAYASAIISTLRIAP